MRDGALRSFPGDYSDYCRAREGRAGSDPAPAAAQPDAPAPLSAKQERMEARARAKQRARDLERAARRVGAIEEEILELEERAEELTAQLAEPEVYRDGDFTRAVQAERGEVRQQIEAHYADWEAAAAELESLRAEGGDDADGL